MKTRNIMKVAAKELIRSAAAEFDLTPLQLIKLFHYSAKAPIPNIRAFAALLCMAKDFEESPAIKNYVTGKSDTIDLVEKVDSQIFINQCTFLYHTIDNFYLRGHTKFSQLSFYPRLEDLFAKSTDAPTETKSSKVLQDVKEELAQPEHTEVMPLQTKGIKWNKQQTAAFARVHAWLRDSKRKQIFRLFGYAGTGKTEMSKEIANFVASEMGKNNVPVGSILFSAYTGKACSVMRTKGCRGADTLHSFLYKPIIDPTSGVCTGFMLNGESPLSQAAILIIDEASMVNDEMAQDILSFDCPVLVLGDPAQLKPVKGEGYFTNAEPDVMLTDIERQAKENPIIYLATRARMQKEIKPGRYGESIVLPQGTHISDDMYLNHDQIICGLNTTRKTINRRMRRINGKVDKNPIYPVAGDKLMCLKNNKLQGLYNGTMWTASTPVMQKIMRPIYKGSPIMRPGNTDVLAFKVRSLDEMDPQGNPYVVQTQCSPHHFNETLAVPEYREIAGTDQFDFGYGATGHKCQGSQYDAPMIFEESSVFRDQKWNHMYTTFTRGVSRITVIL